jgi:hypothetical protein
VGSMRCDGGGPAALPMSPGTRSMLEAADEAERSMNEERNGNHDMDCRHGDRQLPLLSQMTHVYMPVVRKQLSRLKLAGLLRKMPEQHVREQSQLHESRRSKNG